VSLYLALVVYFQFPSFREEEKITRIMDQPDFANEMMESVTTLPAEVVKKYLDAVYAYNLGDFYKAGEFIKKAIKEYEENVTYVELKDHIKEQHFEKVGQIYLFACKTFTQLHENTMAYEYAKKSIQYRASNIMP
jgi:hypothetical protein